MGFLPGTLQPQPGQGLGQRCLSRPPLAHTRCTAKESWGGGGQKGPGDPQNEMGGHQAEPRRDRATSPQPLQGWGAQQEFGTVTPPGNGRGVAQGREPASCPCPPRPPA